MREQLAQQTMTILPLNVVGSGQEAGELAMRPAEKLLAIGRRISDREPE